MAKPSTFTPLVRILDSDTQLAGWQSRMQRERGVHIELHRLLPRALAERIRVAEATSGALVLTAGSGAIAAVLRQRGPDLLANLQRKGWDFTEIKVRVQATGTPATQKKVPLFQRDKVNPAPLDRLAESLPEGPLKRSIERLSRRGR